MQSFKILFFSLESLRKFPPAGSLIRKVTKDYAVPDSGLVFQKGMTVLVSIYGIHHDPSIYPNPEEFDPERFTHENSSKRHPMAFIPFGKTTAVKLFLNNYSDIYLIPKGEGPRVCIGLRFGMIETKIGLALLLSRFRFHKSNKTQLPLSFSKKNIVLSPEGGLHLRIERI